MRGENFSKQRSIRCPSDGVGGQAGVDQTCVHNLECGKNARTSATRHRLYKYAVDVEILNDQHVIIAGSGGRNDKFSGLVRMDLPCGRFENGGETVMRALIDVVGEWKRIRRGAGGG